MNSLRPHLALRQAYLEAAIASAVDAWKIIAAAPAISLAGSIGATVRARIQCQEEEQMIGHSGIAIVARRLDPAPAKLWVAVSNQHPYIAALFGSTLTPYAGGAWRFALAEAPGAWPNQPANFGPIRAKAVLLDPAWCIAHLPTVCKEEASPAHAVRASMERDNG